jgi:excisionase family DNA binding protein
MTALAARRTYVSEDADVDLGFYEFLKSGAEPLRAGGPMLVAADGTQRAIPHEIFEALVQISEALSSGQGVTVMPTDTRLTTQQAADYLGFSRPTLVKLLEGGHIPFSKVGRHRRVMLRDLMAYEEEAGAKRRAAFEELARESAADGSVFKTPDDYSTR